MLSYLYRAIARILGKNPFDDDYYGDPISFDSGPFLDCGIHWVHVSNHFHFQFNCEREWGLQMLPIY